jgi:hypothetical protein
LLEPISFFFSVLPAGLVTDKRPAKRLIASFKAIPGGKPLGTLPRIAVEGWQFVRI